MARPPDTVSGPLPMDDMGSQRPPYCRQWPIAKWANLSADKRGAGFAPIEAKPCEFSGTLWEDHLLSSIAVTVRTLLCILALMAAASKNRGPVLALDCGDGQTKPGVTLALYPFCFEERPTMRGS